MILIGIGGNLPTKKFGSPLRSLKAAIVAINESVCDVIRCSPWYQSAPLPMSSQPNFFNAVAEVKTELTPIILLSRLREIEKQFERVRTGPNAPRSLDLDLLIYHQCVFNVNKGTKLVLPHARMHLRAFVLFPLRDLEPEWIHPTKHRSINRLINDLSSDQKCWKF